LGAAHITGADEVTCHPVVAGPECSEARTRYTPGVTEAGAPLGQADAGPSEAGRASAASRSKTRARRPTAVTILAILQLLNAIGYGLLFALVMAFGSAALEGLPGNGTGNGGPILEPGVDVAIAAVLTGALCIAALAGSVLLLGMRQLGWTITMLLAGLTLAASLVAWLAQGVALEVWLLVQIATVFYLNQRQVRDAFGISGHLAGVTPDRSQE
jgi:hypothetical protein